MKRTYDFYSLCLIPVFTLLLGFGFSLTGTNFSVIGNEEGHRLTFLLWGALTGNYFYLYTDTLMEKADCQDCMVKSFLFLTLTFFVTARVDIFFGNVTFRSGSDSFSTCAAEEKGTNFQKTVVLFIISLSGIRHSFFYNWDCVQPVRNFCHNRDMPVFAEPAQKYRGIIFQSVHICPCQKMVSCDILTGLEIRTSVRT